MSIHHQIPILYASDFAATMAYFVDRLGFVKMWDWGDPASFGAVRRGESRIFICHEGQGKPGTWMSIFVDDVDELHGELARTGADIVHPPRDEAWGMREMQVRCPDDHVIRFGHGLPTAPEMEVERRDLNVRLETRLASVLEELATDGDRTLGQLLEDIVLHALEPVEGKAGEAVASPFMARTFKLIEQLKKKHGVDYDTHASYGFVEKGEQGRDNGPT